LPVIIGVAMARFGDELLPLGLFFASRMRVVLCVKAGTPTRFELHLVDLFGHMVFGLIQCIVISFFTGEIQSIASR
jgi:hypothetical protein